MWPNKNVGASGNNPSSQGSSRWDCLCGNCTGSNLPRCRASATLGRTTAYEIPTKAQSVPNISLHMKHERGETSPTDTHKKTHYTPNQSRNSETVPDENMTADAAREWKKIQDSASKGNPKFFEADQEFTFQATSSYDREKEAGSSLDTKASPGFPGQPASRSTKPDADEKDRCNKDADDSSDSSSDLVEESDSDDDSRTVLRLGPPSDRTEAKVSFALMHIVPLGGLNVVWKWVPAKRRQRQPQAFFAIAQKMTRDLTASRNGKLGSIYAFKSTDAQSRNYIKIGFTETSVEKRMKQHQVCYGECKRLYPPEDASIAPVDHAHRVESLIHAELWEHAMTLVQCPRSRQHHSSHNEWFNVGELQVVAVIRKWIGWMSSGPYEEKLLSPIDEENQSKKALTKNSKQPARKKWQLRKTDPAKLARLCCPLDLSATLHITTNVGL